MTGIELCKRYLELDEETKLLVRLLLSDPDFYERSKPIIEEWSKTKERSGKELRRRLGRLKVGRLAKE